MGRTASGRHGRPTLIDGEDPSTDDQRDIQHWIHIYSELIAHKDRLITSVDERYNMLSTGGKQEADFLRAEMARFQSRYSYWLKRQWSAQGIAIDPQSHCILFESQKIHLTNREFQVLSALHHRFGEFVQPRHLLVAAWGDSFLTMEQLRLYIGRLRAKMRVVGTVEIVTKHGEGYALVPRNLIVG